MRLSTSSLDSAEHNVLNAAVSLSPPLPVTIPHHQQVAQQRMGGLHNGYTTSPPNNRSGSNILKCASQELLSSSNNSYVGSNHDNELNWLDLTLGTLVPNPTSPAPPQVNGFDGNHHLDDVTFSAGSKRPPAGFDNNFNLDIGDSPVDDMAYSTTGDINPQWDNWEGFLNTNYST